MPPSSSTVAPKPPSKKASSTSAPTTPSRTKAFSSKPLSVTHGRPSVAAASTSRSIGSPSTAPLEDAADHSRSSAGDDSVVFSSGGSVVYRPRKSDSSLASDFEVLSVTESIAALKTDPSAPSSSSPGQVKVDPRPSVNSPPGSKAQTASAPRPRDRPAEAPSSRTRTTSGPLSPTAAAFDAQHRSAGYVPSSLAIAFTSILRSGKNVNGDLTLAAKSAMAAHGLKAIPSLHGTSLLPYARNPSCVPSSLHFLLLSTRFKLLTLSSCTLAGARTPSVSRSRTTSTASRSVPRASSASLCLSRRS